MNGPGPDEASSQSRRLARTPCRAELFAGLCILGFANGITGRVQGVLDDDGLGAAVVNTFNISALVWAAFIACPLLLLCSPKDRITRTDRIVAACALGAFLFPIAPMSWVALTGLAFYLIWDRGPGPGPRHLSPAYRSGWILLATTGAMFWGRALLLCLSEPILGSDALLISWFTGAERAGNALRFADGNGSLWIAPGCSSLSNVSLAILCWVLVAQSRGLTWSLRNVRWCLTVCFSVIAINVIRIGLMVMHKDYFDLIHGPAGAAVSNWLIVAVVLAGCLYGTRRGRLARA